MTTDNKAIQVVARNLLEIVVPATPEDLTTKVLETLKSSKPSFEARKCLLDENGQHILIKVGALDRAILQTVLQNIARELQLSFHDLPSTST